jgi:hypothetical protein
MDVLAFARVSGHHIIAWLVIGLVAGVLASLVVRGGGLGFFRDIIVGADRRSDRWAHPPCGDSRRSHVGEDLEGDRRSVRRRRHSSVHHQGRQPVENRTLATLLVALVVVGFAGASPSSPEPSAGDVPDATAAPAARPQFFGVDFFHLVGVGLAHRPGSHLTTDRPWRI